MHYYLSCPIYVLSTNTDLDGHMSLETAILGFLGREPMSGYDLKTRCFDRAAAHAWPADQAQVYRTLDRLERDGLVSARPVAQRGRPDRRLWTLTDAGRSDLLRRLSAAPGPLSVRDPLWLRLFLAADVPDDVLLSVLGSARDLYQTRLDRLRGETTRAVEAWAALGDERDAALERMSLRSAIAAARAAVDQIDDCIDEVAGGLPPRRGTGEHAPSPAA